MKLGQETTWAYSTMLLNPQQPTYTTMWPFLQQKQTVQLGNKANKWIDKKLTSKIKGTVCWLDNNLPGKKNL